MITADERCRSATATLLRFGKPRTGKWVTPTGEAWQPALAIEALLNAYDRISDPAHLSVVAASFRRYHGRRSRFHDDDGWFLNAWLRAYDSTGDTRFLAEAAALFADLTPGWDDTCGGGLWWTRDRRYKNAITNELFLLAAARLHRRAPNGTGPGSYLDWAQRAWDWFDASAMINPAGAVNDGLGDDCRNNGGTVWTYNQGVILSALVELWRITDDSAQLTRAHQIAGACLTSHVDADGFLAEPCEPDGCDGDQMIFKGVFAQGLARLYHADPTGHDDYRTFLRTSADRLWHASRDRRGRLGLVWRGPGVRFNAATHISGALLLSLVALLDEGGEAGPGRIPP